jgi:hypothetical protein
MRQRWIFLFTLCTLFLAACSELGTVGGVETVDVTLTADVAEVPAEGGSVTLSATIDGEGATLVEFAEIDQATALAVDDLPDDGFTAVVNVVPPTSYIAVAKNAEGEIIGTSNEVAVAATTTPGPNPEPTPPGPTPPGPTPPAPEPSEPGGPIPTDAVLATTPEEINAAPAGATIVLTQNITCAVDPCITLKDGQRLLGGKDGQLLTTPGVKITTSLPTEGVQSTVVVMANDTAVEGLEFDGEDIYQAMNASATVTGAVTVRNVSVTTPTANNPIDMRSTGALTLENLAFTTTRAVFIEGFSSATLSGLQLTINRAAATTGAALTIVSGQASTLTLAGLELTTNLGGEGKDGVLIQSGVLPTDAGAMTVTVKDSTVTFPAADIATSVAFNFNLVGTGSLAIQTPESTGNTTNSSYAFKATYDTGVTGTITLP